MNLKKILANSAIVIGGLGAAVSGGFLTHDAYKFNVARNSQLDYLNGGFHLVDTPKGAQYINANTISKGRSTKLNNSEQLNYRGRAMNDLLALLGSSVLLAGGLFSKIKKNEGEEL